MPISLVHFYGWCTQRVRRSELRSCMYTYMYVSYSGAVYKWIVSMRIAVGTFMYIDSNPLKRECLLLGRYRRFHWNCTKMCSMIRQCVGDKPGSQRSCPQLWWWQTGYQMPPSTATLLGTTPSYSLGPGKDESKHSLWYKTRTKVKRNYAGMW